MVLRPGISSLMDVPDKVDIPSNDEWIHHVVVKEGEELRYYRDGTLANDRVLDSEMLSPDPMPFYMGGQDFRENWRGYLSDVQLYDHPLSEEEIAAIIGDTMPGDYNNNGELDVEDLDLQAAAIFAGDNPPEFDLNGDGVVDFNGDRIMWLHDLKVTWVGDADLNGLFDSSDFVAVFVEGKYETGEAAGWASGDWNADLVFDSGDFVAAFVDGGYEAGEFPGAVQAVPEPSSVVLTLLGLLSLIGWIRRR